MINFLGSIKRKASSKFKEEALPIKARGLIEMKVRRKYVLSIQQLEQFGMTDMPLFPAATPPKESNEGEEQDVEVKSKVLPPVEDEDQPLEREEEEEEELVAMEE